MILVMNMCLHNCKKKLDIRLKTIDSCFDRMLRSSAINRKRNISKIVHNDGLVSYLWQSWSYFCKDIIISSVKGSITEGGLPTTSEYSQLDIRQIITLAKLFAQGKPCPEQIKLSNEWSDAVWGDLNKINLIISGLTISNGETLLSAFGTMQEIKSLQVCRNACAHINPYTINKVKELRFNYSETKIKHPADMMFWVSPATGEYLWKCWIEEISLAAEFSIK